MGMASSEGPIWQQGEACARGTTLEIEDGVVLPPVFQRAGESESERARDEVAARRGHLEHVAPKENMLKAKLTETGD